MCKNGRELLLLLTMPAGCSCCSRHQRPLPSLHAQAFLAGGTGQAFIRYDGPEAAGQDCEAIVDRLTRQAGPCVLNRARRQPCRLDMLQQAGFSVACASQYSNQVRRLQTGSS